MRWMNEPPTWTDDGTTLTIHVARKTDFWRKTLVKYIADSGHFYYQTVDGDFVASVRVEADYRDQYDQAGLFVRQDSLNWIKCGVEIVNGKWARDYEYRGSAHLIMAGLTTGGWSEWSTLPQLPENPPGVWIRVIREGKTLFVDYSLDGETFTILKLCAMPSAKQLKVGRFAAAPTGTGFAARFTKYTVASDGAHKI